MEIEEEKAEKEINIEEISANELFSKLEKWNEDITTQIEKEGKKDKKKFKKLKEKIIKFNRMPTPIQGVELIDIKLGARLAEDDIFLEEDFINKHLRRGETLFYNKNNNTYDYARFGLPKFFDYKKKFDSENEKDKLQQERVIGNMIKIKENKENVKYLAYLTTKVNGENFQVSYNKKYSCWIIASKNVSLAIKNKDDINFYKDFNNFKEYIEENKKEEKEEILDEKEKKKLKNKEKKKEKKRKKMERLERRKKGKENDNKIENEEEEDEKEENENKININNKENKNENKKYPILERYIYAIDFAETWLNLLKERIVDKNLLDQFISELGDYTLIGESVGDKKREHILVYNQRDIIFYSIINNTKLLSEKCLPLSKSFELFKKYNLTYTPIQPSEKYDTLNDLFSFINTQYDVIFDKSLQESGEGNVVYFSSEINGNERVENLLKTFEYRFFRKIREKCKGIEPLNRDKIESAEMVKFNQRKKKKERKKKDEEKNDENSKKEEEEEKKEKDRIKNNIEREIREINKKREEKMERLMKKLKKESSELLSEVENSKYNDDNLKTKYFNFAEYILKYRLIDSSHYFDVFASFIEIMKEKFEQNAEINEQMVSEIQKKFEGLIDLNNNKDDEKEEEDDKEDPKEE